MTITSLAGAPDALLRAAHAVQRDHDLRLYPDDVPVTWAEFEHLSQHDRRDDNDHQWEVVVDDAGEPVVVLHVEIERSDENDHVLVYEMWGHHDRPDATAEAMARLVEIARAENRRLIWAWTPLAEPDITIWGDYGMASKLVERESLLVLDQVDPTLMQQWIDRRAERAGDIRIVRWTSHAPDEHLEAFAASRTQMNDAPTDDLEVNDALITADEVRRDEAARVAMGTEVRTIMALAPDGTSAGHTTVHVNDHRPSESWQWDTVTIPAFRGRGIGRFLKAAMWQWLRADRPDVTRLRTGNAESNDAMLSINVAMGFREDAKWAVYSAETDTIAARLAD